MKKNLIILLIVVVGAGVLYFLLGGKAPSGLPIIGGSPFGTPPDQNDGGSATSSDSGENGAPTGGENGLGANGQPINPLFKVSEGPIAGGVSFLKNGSEYVRYVDRATGHVTEVKISTLERTKILNTTRPHIYEAIWKSDGSGFIERSLDGDDEVISNMSVSISKPSSTSTDGLLLAKLTLLRGDVGDIVVTPDGSLVYNLRDTGAVAISSFLGERPRTLFTMPFTSWKILPVSNTLSLISTKPSAFALGYAYNLDLRSGSLTKVLGPLPALSIKPSSDGGRIAYSFNGGDKMELQTQNLKTKVVSTISPATLAEKCVWSKKLTSILICGIPESGLGREVPDLWYQGVTTYSDKVWRFNVDTETAEILLDPEGGFNLNVDVTDPALSPDEGYLLFTNKNDLSLWAIRLLP